MIIICLVMDGPGFVYMLILGVSLVLCENNICTVCDCDHNLIHCQNRKLYKIPSMKPSLYSNLFIHADLSHNSFTTQAVSSWLHQFDHPKLVLDLRYNTNCLHIDTNNYEVCYRVIYHFNISLLRLIYFCL